MTTPRSAQAVVVSAGGRLTVALYTIRTVQPGEELTFDYACVTESEEEFRQAFCMCSSRACRGSYLHYTGSKAYMQARCLLAALALCMVVWCAYCVWNGGVWAP